MIQFLLFLDKRVPFDYCMSIGMNTYKKAIAHCYFYCTEGEKSGNTWAGGIISATHEKKEGTLPSFFLGVAAVILPAPVFCF